MSTNGEGQEGRCGAYRLVRRVDQGGMGEIFVARSEEGQTVAIKRILPQLAKDPTFLGMFQDEGRLAVHLQHENICRVYETGEADGFHFLVMEWIEGMDLRALLNRAREVGPFPLGIAARIAHDVALALDYAHRLTDESNTPLGIVHRDVSPPNIMISKEGTVKLLDFGLAKAKSQVHKTLPGVVKGKFRYLAPEQTQTQPIDARADVFALGLCFYEMLTAKALFDQDGDLDTVLALRAHKGAPSVRAVRPDLPEAVDELLRRALEPKPEDRFSSAGELAAALEPLMRSANRAAIAAFLSGPGRTSAVDAPIAPPAIAEDSSPSATPGKRGSRAWIWMLAAGVVAGAVAAALLLTGG